MSKDYRIGDSKKTAHDNFDKHSILLKKTNGTQLLQASWVWNAKVTREIAKRITGYSLNCPAGASKLGDMRGDLYPIDKEVQKMDMYKLPFPDNTFDTVISDPPWKINFFKRSHAFFECVRVCKPGGRIIYNATWIPTSKYVKLQEVIVRQDSQFTQASVICVFKKGNQRMLFTPNPKATT